MSRQDTYESLCVLLEEYSGEDVETIAEQILGLLGLMGEETVVALDPPPGLQHWLVSHGLSLVQTQEITRADWPSVTVTGRDELAPVEEEPEDLEGEPGESLPLQVGDYVEYRTAPAGPNNHMALGSGTIKSITADTIEVEFSPRGAGIMLFPEVDLIQRVRSAPLPDS